MAIQPIDQQTLFAQMDKVGKTQMAQREGQAVQQMIQGQELQRKTEEHIKSVNEAQDMGDGTQKVKDRGAGQQSGGGKKNEKKEPEPETEEKKAMFFSDPALGRNIDIRL